MSEQRPRYGDEPRVYEYELTAEALTRINAELKHLRAENERLRAALEGMYVDDTGSVNYEARARAAQALDEPMPER